MVLPQDEVNDGYPASIFTPGWRPPPSTSTSAKQKRKQNKNVANHPEVPSVGAPAEQEDQNQRDRRLLDMFCSVDDRVDAPLPKPTLRSERRGRPLSPEEEGGLDHQARCQATPGRV